MVAYFGGYVETATACGIAEYLVWLTDPAAPCYRPELFELLFPLWAEMSVECRGLDSFWWEGVPWERFDPV